MIDFAIVNDVWTHVYLTMLCNIKCILQFGSNKDIHHNTFISTLTARGSTLDVRIRRPILTSKVDPRTVIIRVDPQHRYSTEAERAN